jgi:hypothetical protein
VRARFVPFLLWEYRRDWAAACAVLAIALFLGWVAWERLPRDAAKPAEVLGTVRTARRTWQPESKYILVRRPLAEIEVALPDGGTERLTGEIALLGKCLPGRPIRLMRRVINSGATEWSLMANPCG